MEEHINMQTQTQFQQVRPYPGRRYFARMLDITLYGILWLCIQYFVFRWDPESGLFLNILINLITLAMMLFLEPLLLYTWGTTPGKWLFGLCVIQENGGKLTYRRGLRRTFGLIRFGFGFGLPIYSLIRNFISYTACMKGMPMRWDEGIQYRLLDRKIWRIFACLLSYIACFALIFLIFLQSHMPKYRGNITPEQYAANVNEMMYRDRNSMAITPEGKWFERKDMRGSYYTYGYDLLPNHLTIQDGTVVGIRIAREHHSYIDKGSIPDYSGQRRIMLYAFLAAQRGVNCLEIAFDPEIRQIFDATKSYTFEKDGVRVTSFVEYSGYTHESYRAFSPTEGMENDYRMSFEIVRTDI